MKTISSPYTWIFKFIFPSIILFFASLMLYRTYERDLGWEIILINGILLGITLVYLYRYQFSLMKIKHDDQYLYISNFRSEQKVPISSINKVVYTLYLAEVVHIYFNINTEVGDAIRFRGIMRSSNLLPYPMVEYLAKLAGLNDRPDVYKALRTKTVL